MSRDRDKEVNVGVEMGTKKCKYEWRGGPRSTFIQYPGQIVLVFVGGGGQIREYRSGDGYK